jgi:hypothetical protein
MRSEAETEIKNASAENNDTGELRISLEEFDGVEGLADVAESEGVDMGDDKVVAPPSTPPLPTWRSADVHLKSMRSIRTSSFFAGSIEKLPVTTPQPVKSSPAVAVEGRSVPPLVTERVPPSSVSPMQSRIYTDAYPRPGWLPSPSPAPVTTLHISSKDPLASTSPGPASHPPRGSAVSSSFDLVLARQELRRAQQRPLAKVLTLRETVAAINCFVREKRAADEAVHNAWADGTRPAPKLLTMEAFVLKSTWEKVQRLRVTGESPRGITSSPPRVRNPAKELALSYLKNGHERETEREKMESPSARSALDMKSTSRSRISGHGTAENFRAAHEMENLAVFVQSVRAHCSKADMQTHPGPGGCYSPVIGANDMSKSAVLDEQADVDAFHYVWVGAADEELFVVQRSLRAAIKDLLSHFELNDGGKDGYIGREEWTSIVHALYGSDVHIHMHASDLARTRGNEGRMRDSDDEEKEKEKDLYYPKDSGERWHNDSQSILPQNHAHNLMHTPTTSRPATPAAATSQAIVFEILELLDARAQVDHAATVGARQLSLLSANTGFLGQSSFRKLGYNVKSSACMSTLRKFASQRLRNQVTNAVVDLGDQFTASSQCRASGAEVRLRLPVKVFVKTLLDLQLQQHVNFLAPLSTAFMDADSDRDGVLSRDQFSRLFMHTLRKADYHIVPQILLENVYGKNWLGNVVILETKGRPDTIACQSVLDKLFADIDPFFTDCVTFSRAAAAICRLCSQLL